MANNKKHHFVPQFYLKNFSCDGKSISLFNKRSVRKVFSAGIKTQCYRDYFYGKDLKLENWLAKVEGKVANVFKKIITSQAIPERKDEMYEDLLLYIAIQASRTTYAAEEMSQVRDLSSDKRYSLNESESAHTALQYAMRMLPAYYSLSSKLIINHTKEKFITSDNPCVFYNILTEKLNISGGSHVNSLGLKIFLPISPELMLVFYDQSTFKLGSKKIRQIELNDLSDAVALNKLQFVSCEQNIYFKDKAYDPMKLHHAIKKYYKVQKLEVLGKTSKYGVNANRVDTRTNLKLSILTLKKKARLILKSRDEKAFMEGRDTELTNQYIQMFNQSLKSANNDSDFHERCLELAKFKSMQMLEKG